MAQLLLESEPIKAIRRGDVVAGEVMSVDEDGILVDIGYKSEGFIPFRESRSLSAEELDSMCVGDKILAYIIQLESDQGQAILSVDKAQGERGWLTLQKGLDEGVTIEGVIKGFNRGGAVVEVEGVQGFVPISQLAPLDRNAGVSTQEAVLAQRVGQTVQMRLLEVNRRRNRVILSERQAIQHKREEEKDRLLQELREGEVRQGRVSGISSFGVFVDLGGADGLIHISELSWEQVQSPEDVVKVGDELDVYILKVDMDSRKIALSLRRLQPEPWQTMIDLFQVGQLVQGTVTKLTTFGAFARIEGSIEGLIHISELADRMITHPKEVVTEGDDVRLRIIKIDPERRRLGLSLKQADESWDEETQAG